MKFLDPKALRDWIKSRAVNNLMATAKGFFLDARVGPVIQEKIDEVKEEVNEINGNLQQNINGRFVLPGGLKICWGNIGYGAPLEVSFPFVFSKQPIVIASGQYTNLETITQVVRVYDTTVAGFKCVNQYFSNTDGTVTHLHNSISQGINWIAIGY